ncbi:hypothetical protein N9H60_04140 [Flavimaricola sp.]|nr:hypothetical protein [Flavimaricola sp.]MDA9020340.1 hypothetical protein [Flavimaricola sp.]
MLLRLDPRCVHRGVQPLTPSSNPEQIARFHFGQGYPEFEVSIDLQVQLPIRPIGLTRHFTTGRFEAALAKAEAEAKDRAIAAIVEVLDARLSVDEKRRLLALLEDVQTASEQ